MQDSEEQRLIDRLRKVEALFARPGTDGERGAARSALDRIRARLRSLEQTAPPIEFRFSFADAWSTSLFIALLRRYGLKPYRYPGQRRTTVMVKVTKVFTDETLLPEFQQFQTLLREHLEAVTDRVIAQAISGDDAAVEVRPGKESTR